MPIKRPDIAATAPSFIRNRPVFGEGNTSDLHLGTGESNLGNKYQLPSNYTYGSDRARNLLTGSRSFLIDEIEVFYGGNGGKFI